MAVLGLGAGAVAAGGVTVVTTILAGGAGYLAFHFARGTEETALRAIKKEEIPFINKYRWQFSCLFAIGAVGAAMIACSAGYVGFMLAKAVWLKTSVPSLVIPLGTATGGVLLAAGFIFGMYQLAMLRKQENLAK